MLAKQITNWRVLITVGGFLFWGVPEYFRMGKLGEIKI